MKKILQIGEGNFLRAFAEYYIQTANNSGKYDYEVFVCQPRKNLKVINALKNQNCKYNIYLKGNQNSKIVDDTVSINCISQCIDTVGEYDLLLDLIKSENLQFVISNTTEAGICFDSNDKLSDCPNTSFPAKVTSLLYQRYKATNKGLIFLPVELIENNGDALKKCVLKYIDLWNLDDEFKSYVNDKCYFCNTLVDRIVTGHIEGDSDACSVACEPYESWIIQADDNIKQIIPFDKINLNCILVDDLSLYRTRKVRILNGAHTMSVLAGYLSGFDIVRDMVNDKLFNNYITKGLEEIKQTINLPKSELDDFASSVLERFNNPFIDHKLLDISLNSISKFKARCLCSIIDYIKINNQLPKLLTFSLSALIAFYTHKGSERKYDINDNQNVLEFFDSIKSYSNDKLVNAVLSNVDFWDVDLTKIDELENAVLCNYNLICNKGIEFALNEVVNG